jgi:hypothetical protein
LREAPGHEVEESLFDVNRGNTELAPRAVYVKEGSLEDICQGFVA